MKQRRFRVTTVQGAFEKSNIANAILENNSFARQKSFYIFGCTNIFYAYYIFRKTNNL